jgi:hypothetical protein
VWHASVREKHHDAISDRLDVENRTVRTVDSQFTAIAWLPAVVEVVDDRQLATVALRVVAVLDVPVVVCVGTSTRSGERGHTQGLQPSASDGSTQNYSSD